ncbi:MAG TPA: YkgJ family cysteine cluster protein [Candidatus Gastranaerophilales bacterium]|nr:YkgJ family cysteine cluster protein [Candidatus Gastranaerophilales bacterium]
MKVCKACAGGCCRAFNVPITGFDILRIMRTIDIDPFFFCGVEEISGERLEKGLEKDPLFIFTDSGEPKYYEIYLKRVFSKCYEMSLKCIFLQEWDAKELGSQEVEGIIGRCGIYDCRPLACRNYPAKIDKENKLSMYNPYYEHTNPENKRWKSLPYGLCPRPVELDDFKAGVDEYIKNLVHGNHELEFFIELSKKWNETPDISDKFIEFLEKEYKYRLPLK